MIDYPFTAAEMQAANAEWGCNCGPASLAFALQIGLDRARVLIDGFEERRYTNPTMMRYALRKAGVKFTQLFKTEPAEMFHVKLSLVRIQWIGPWTEPCVNPKAAYRYTHWIAAWATREAGEFLGYKATRVGLFVFDCNDGICSFEAWKKETVPAILAGYPRAYGTWKPTHIWRVG